MVMRTEIDDFLGQKTLAVAGVSRQGHKIGNAIFRDLKSKGFRVFPIHPHVDRVEDEPAYASVAALPEPVEGLVVCVPPRETEKIVREAHRAGIRRVWLQPGADSKDAIAYGRENGLTVVHGHCILMFVEPVGWFHRSHRWLWRILGKLPR